MQRTNDHNSLQAWHRVTFFSTSSLFDGAPKNFGHVLEAWVIRFDVGFRQVDSIHGVWVSEWMMLNGFWMYDKMLCSIDGMVYRLCVVLY